MIRTLSPYSTTAKTAEIMSRYRPIAPKPDGDAASSNITQSPYLRKLWPQLQARPTRTRKRGRSTMSPISSLKRTRTTPPPPQPFQFPLTSASSSPSLVTLPLLSPVPDLNVAPDQTQDVLEEKCLVIQLNDSPRSSSSTGVISPQPLRPIGSSISVGCINEDPGCIPSSQMPKTVKEVEEEVDSDILPAVVSDSNNKVRLANSAYKEMVGQPECRWLETMVGGDGKQRICGEVRLSARVPVWSKGFSCWVRIDWETRDGKMKGVNAFCDVTRLDCESKDYLFTWRFHTRPPLSSQSSSNIALSIELN